MKKAEFEEQLVKEVTQDWKERQNARRQYELAWLLNMNFLSGNQYADISPLGEIVQEDRDFFWQEKQVFNHIAPIIETRLARLSSVRPKMLVRPFSNEEGDIESSKLATKILSYLTEKLNIENKIAEATAWSEACGTAFYKVVWNDALGEKIQTGAQTAVTGDVDLIVCSPFEIYPDSNATSDVNGCSSLIHAKAYHVEDIKKLWGAELKGEKINALTVSGASFSGRQYNGSVRPLSQEVKENHVVVIERYTKPNKTYPKGQLVIVAENKVLYCGEMPYFNGKEGAKEYPFIRQVCHKTVGCFWGNSIVERLIPLQRSYNAVKNRKHEFLNRISMGVLTVEDGSLDTDNLEEEGLQPGKILIYKQGGVKPSLLEGGNVPSDFSYEEDRLLNEFIVISGVSELARNSSTPVQVTSGTALQLLIEQDETRLSSTAEEIKNAVKQIGKYSLRLYKQYASALRLVKTVCDNGSVEIKYFTSSDLTSDDIVFETENQLSDSVANRRGIVTDLLKMGLLHDKNEKLSESTKVKVLEMMGMGNWESARDLSQLHRAKAQRENLEAGKNDLPLEIDDHEIHIDVHIAYCISGEAEKEGRLEIMLAHIAVHKEMAKRSERETL